MKDGFNKLGTVVEEQIVVATIRISLRKLIVDVSYGISVRLSVPFRTTVLGFEVIVM